MVRRGAATEIRGPANTAAEDDDPLRDAERLARDARLAARRNQLGESARRASEALELAMLVVGPEERRADVLLLIARVLRELDDLERCETAARAALVAEVRCERPLVLGRVTLFLAHVLRDRGNLDDAAAAAQWAYLCYARARGPRHPETRAVGVLLEQLARLRELRPPASHRK